MTERRFGAATTEVRHTCGVARWRLTGMRAVQAFLGHDSEQQSDEDGIDWRRRRIGVAVAAIVIAALFIALQLRIEAVVRDNDLPESCAMRGQPCHTTTTAGPRSAE